MSILKVTVVDYRGAYVHHVEDMYKKKFLELVNTYNEQIQATIHTELRNVTRIIDP